MRLLGKISQPQTIVQIALYIDTGPSKNKTGYFQTLHKGADFKGSIAL